MKQAIKHLLRKLFWGLGRYLMSDKWYAKVRYWIELDEWPNLKNPQKFTEKIQWIKLNEHNKLRRKAANRLAVRNFVVNKIGEQHLIPLHNAFDVLTKEIWKTLPKQFVLKANHGCKMVKIVRNKEKENFGAACRHIKQWQQTDYYRFSREWAYKGLPRTILVEKLLLDDDESIPKDYKFFCFNGKVKIIQIDYNRFGKQKRNLFDCNFNRIDGELLYPPYEKNTKKPPQLEDAIIIAENLSADFTFLRVDLYLLNEHIYFGELTNYPGNGFVPFKPEELEYKVGSFLNI